MLWKQRMRVFVDLRSWLVLMFLLLRRWVQNLRGRWCQMLIGILGHSKEFLRGLRSQLMLLLSHHHIIVGEEVLRDNGLKWLLAIQLLGRSLHQVSLRSGWWISSCRWLNLTFMLDEGRTLLYLLALKTCRIIFVSQSHLSRRMIQVNIMYLLQFLVLWYLQLRLWRLLLR
jgi:hypothetical protein